MSYAIVLRKLPRTVADILMILDDRPTANEIAFELRRSGHDVEVIEMNDPL